MTEGCSEKECTVAQTGICLLNNDPKSCPQRIEEEIAPDISSEIGDLSPPAENPTFPPSLALSLSDTSALMTNQYCRLVGILGAPDAGKTAVLVCLYLLLASQKLAGYEFRNSRTLLAFEEISRGARRWKQGDSPGEMTQHTEARDERAAGFLHFRLVRTETNDVADILFPDLPGEWSTSLIDLNRSDRLDFLRSADVIWIMIDGVELAERSKRQTALHRTGLLLQRIRTMLGPNLRPIRLVISRRDKGELHPDKYQILTDEAVALGFDFSVSQIASFSEEDSIAPGVGIAELISTLFEFNEKPSEMWPNVKETGTGRQMLRFRMRSTPDGE